MCHITLLVCYDVWLQVYWAGVHPKFPEGGKMTQHLAAMKVSSSSSSSGNVIGHHQQSRHAGQVTAVFSAGLSIHMLCKK
jgi:hypothetical protein